MARKNDKVGGKISRGRCEGCKLDLGNVLDPYCWRCAQQLERAVNQRKQERLRELMKKGA